MPNIHFATPCYGGQINEVCFQSYMNWTILAMQNDLAFTIDTLSNESNINRGRNSCAAKFLAGDCTHLMFVDADIGWNPVDVVKIVNHQKMMIQKIIIKKNLKLFFWYFEYTIEIFRIFFCFFR